MWPIIRVGFGQLGEGIVGIGVNQKPDFNSWETQRNADMSTCQLHHCLWGSVGTLAHSPTERRLQVALGKYAARIVAHIALTLSDRGPPRSPVSV